MKKAIPYIALIPLVVLALTPPWRMVLDCKLNSLFWLYMVFSSGFLTFLYMNFKVSVFLKLFLIWCFVSCFLSYAPYLCFTMYWSMIAGAYYYLLCKQIEDFEPVKKVIQALFFFVTLLIIVQLFGKDTLLNFNQKDPLVLGTIGNYMILGSLVCILAPFLIQISWLNWIPVILIAFITKSSGTVLSIFAGLGVYLSYIAIRRYWNDSRRHQGGFIGIMARGRLVMAIVLTASVIVATPVFMAYKTGDFKVFTTAGRYQVWKRTVQLANNRPQGYGVATYRLIFPLLSQDLKSSVGANGEKWEYENTTGKGLAWRKAHNCFTQILFETGWYGFVLFMGFIGAIAWRVRRDPLKLAGLAILGVNMMVHFPSRMTQSVLIMIMYLAFCEAKEKIYGTR